MSRRSGARAATRHASDALGFLWARTQPAGNLSSASASSTQIESSVASGVAKALGSGTLPSTGTLAVNAAEWALKNAGSQFSFGLESFAKSGFLPPRCLKQAQHLSFCLYSK